MNQENHPTRLPLLTPAQAAQKLLEEATLQAWRTNGLDGLSPVKDGRRKMFRPQDVDAFVRAIYQRAA